MNDIGHDNFCMCNDCFKNKLLRSYGAKNMITMTRRYYMGTTSIREGSSLLKLLPEAIKEAKDYLEHNPTTEERYIVEVVKIVRRERIPIIVEDVRRG